MIPFALQRLRLQRLAGGGLSEGTEPPTVSVVIPEFRGNIVNAGASGGTSGGESQVFDAKLVADVGIDVRNSDQVVDLDTDQVWEVIWGPVPRSGFGLSHITAGLRLTLGAP